MTHGRRVDNWCVLCVFEISVLCSVCVVFEYELCMINNEVQKCVIMQSASTSFVRLQVNRNTATKQHHGRYLLSLDYGRI